MFLFQEVQLSGAQVQRPPLFNLRVINISDSRTAENVVTAGLLAKWKPGITFLDGADKIILGKLGSSMDHLQLKLEDFASKSCPIDGKIASLPFSFTGLDQKGQEYFGLLCRTAASDEVKVGLLKGVYLDQYNRDPPKKVSFSDNLQELNSKLAEKGFAFSLTKSNLKKIMGKKRSGMPDKVEITDDNGQKYVLELSTRTEGNLNIFKRNGKIPSDWEYEEYLNKAVQMNSYLTAKKLQLVEQEYGAIIGFDISKGVALVQTQTTLIQISVWDAIKEILPDITKNLDFTSIHGGDGAGAAAAMAAIINPAMDKVVDHASSLTENNTRQEYDAMTSKGAYDRLKARMESIFSIFASSQPVQLVAKTINEFMQNTILAMQNDDESIKQKEIAISKGNKS